MKAYKTHTWHRVVVAYREYASEAERFAAMAELVEQIAHSPLAPALYPRMTHGTLRLYAHEWAALTDDQIQVAHDGEAFEVRYVSTPGVRRHSVIPITSAWRKRSSDGFAALERCLHYLRWVVEERPARSPASVRAV